MAALTFDAVTNKYVVSGAATTNPTNPGSGGGGVTNPSSPAFTPQQNAQFFYPNAQRDASGAVANTTPNQPSPTYTDANGKTVYGTKPITLNSTTSPTGSMSSDAATVDTNSTSDLIKTEQANLQNDYQTALGNADRTFNSDKQDLQGTQNQENATEAATQFRLGRTGSAQGDAETAGLNDLHDKQINTLRSQRATALQAAQKAFNDGNVSLAKEALQGAKDAATAQLNAQKAADEKKSRDIQNALNVQQLADKEKQDNFDNIMKSNEYDLSSKKAAFDQYIQTANLTEKQKQDAADNYFKAQDLDLKKQAQGGGGLGVMPSVTMTGSETPNVTEQTQFLNALPGGATGQVATAIKGMANYTLNPASFSTSAKQAQSGLTRGELVTLAQQYDPSFNEANWASRQALITNFSSGKYSQSVNSLNTAVGHISDILGNFSGVAQHGNSFVNAAQNELATLFGSGAPVKANLNINAATGELARLFTGVGATKDEMAALGSISANSSPDQIKNYIEAASQLLGSKLSALGDTYQSGMGKAKKGGFLSPASQQALLDLQAKGFNIKVPELADSPIVKIQTYRASLQPDQQTALDTFMANHPEFKNNPQGAIDSLNQNGVNL